MVLVVPSVWKGVESARVGTGACLTETESASSLVSMGSEGEEEEDRDQNPLIVYLNDEGRLNRTEADGETSKKGGMLS